MTRKRLILITGIIVAVVIMGIYGTYALDIIVSEGTTTDYDMSLTFDIYTNTQKQVTIPAGKTKVFDIDINNPQTDTIQYGVAYSMVSPTELPYGAIVAQSSLSPNPAVGTLEPNTTKAVSIIVVNESTSDITLQLSVINGYKNGGNLIVPTGKTLISEEYQVGPPPAASETIMTLASEDACAEGGKGVCATNSYTAADGSTAYHDYRYRGAEVDNYVWFNNDMYRIIGVFDENSHGKTGQQLVKLIAANPLMSTSYGAYNSSATSGTYSSYNNDWTGNTTGVKANANVLLNEYFYGKTNTSNTYGACSTWTYYYYNNDYRTNDCSDIVGYGINNTLQSYIEEVTWYLKGYEGNGYSKQNFYLCERGQSTDTTNCMSGNSGACDASTTARIGLVYVSDYMYASSYYADTDEKTGSEYYYGNNNWLYKGYEWTITPDANSANYAFTVGSTGRVAPTLTSFGLVVRPSFYLKSNVSITGGKGTFDSPFTLSI